MGLTAVAVLLVGVLVPGVASAGDRVGDRTGNDLELQFSWKMSPPPSLRLQPERARLVLNLPPEWMPAGEPSRLGSIMDPRKSWEFRGEHQLTSASIGGSFGLSISNTERAISFALRVMPRAAVAELRFDPIPAQMR